MILLDSTNQWLINIYYRIGDVYYKIYGIRFWFLAIFVLLCIAGPIMCWHAYLTSKHLGEISEKLDDLVDILDPEEESEETESTKDQSVAEQLAHLKELVDKQDELIKSLKDDIQKLK